MRKSVGVIAPLPYSCDIGPAIPQMREHINWLSHMHISGLWILGTTAECPYIELWWKFKVIRELVPCAKELGFAAYCGVWDTQPHHVNMLARTAKEAGADALFCMTPIFTRISDNEMLAYYERVLRESEEAGLPLYLYDFPQKSGNQISLDVIAALLAKYPCRIVGIKDSSGDVGRIGEIVKRFGPLGFTVLAGTNTKVVEARKAGAHGVVGSLANISPELMYQAWEFRSKRAQARLLKEAALLEEYGGPRAINAWLQKWSMAGKPNYPHEPLSAYEKRNLFSRLRNP